MISFSQWGNELYSGKRSYNIVGRGKRYLMVGLSLMVISIILLAARGLNPSIEFSGGSQFIVTGAPGASQKVAYDTLAAEGLKENIRVSSLGTDSIRIQTQSLDTAQTKTLRADLADAYGVAPDDVQTNSVGATWSQDVTKKAIQSIVIFVLLVAVILTIYFRSWTMSVAALVALAHDLVITIGFFALVQVEVSPATVIGFLTILGYSLYDTVVVFDKVRELTANFQEQRRYTYGQLVNLAVNQTLVRSVNTSVVALLPVGSILFIGSLLLGAGTLTDISLALFVGIVVGTFSSIFIAAPVLSMLQGKREKTRAIDTAITEARSKTVEDGSKHQDEAVVVGTRNLTPGRHLGQSAQPKRKRKGK
ncbi:protein translocase subunit SecF [Actinomyces minihominis]|uniref:protein translocase subunit SecF n=1 Tax=Actinomyces minihominis TaxID=2002838 RepID=UPI000C0757AA|nr:protein translocase subunit SecF [Actinomyces minihominis]